MTWAEVTRKLKAAGFVEVRSGTGSHLHLLLKHPTTGKEVWVAVHTKKDAGRLGNRIFAIEPGANHFKYGPQPQPDRHRSRRARLGLAGADDERSA